MNFKAIDIEKIDGGVCAPKGFMANGVHCGIKAGSDPDKKDLAMIVSERMCAAAGVYTTNKVKGAPITVTKDNIADGYAQAVICNSGNANTCNADGLAIAFEMSALCADAVNKAEILPIERPEAGQGVPGMRVGKNPRRIMLYSDVIVGSTGVIGEPLNIEPVKAAVDALAEGLSHEGSTAAAEAIMTTDTVKKEAAFEFELGGKKVRLGGIAKGSGMIHPNMATMLVFLTTDAMISPGMLQKALDIDIPETFNMISVDGDTSTNDTVTIMANGMAENPMIETEGEDFDAFLAALHELMSDLCRRIARDGEGATKLLTGTVTGAPDHETARTVAKTVICSSLVKAAVYGGDANWGRILCAIGYSPADIDVTKVEVSIRSAGGEVAVCRDGAGVPFSEEEAAKVLAAEEVEILIDLHDGPESATAWGCDLTHDYVTINADYRT